MVHATPSKSTVTGYEGLSVQRKIRRDLLSQKIYVNLRKSADKNSPAG
jgi:hypothetical protein